MASADPAAQHEWLARKSRNRQTRDYRAFVGPPELYDVVGAMQFNLLTHLGLRESHFLLDVGCGSLRAGRLFIPYLLPGHYCGIEPEEWLIDEGIRNEIGADMKRIKRPRFSNDHEFNLSTLNQKFDFIVAQSVFSHASQRQIGRCLAEARKVMMPSAVFVATFVRGGVNYAGDQWVHVASYTLERMMDLAREAGLLCEPIGWPHPTSQQWILLRRRGEEGGNGT